MDPQQLAKATCSDHTEENEEDYTREQSAQSEQPPATIDEGQTVKMIEHAWISIAFLRYVVILYCLFLHLGMQYLSSHILSPIDH